MLIEYILMMVPSHKILLPNRNIPSNPSLIMKNNKQQKISVPKTPAQTLTRQHLPPKYYHYSSGLLQWETLFTPLQDNHIIQTKMHPA